VVPGHRLRTQREGVMDGVMYWVGVVVVCLFLAVLPLVMFGLLMVYRWAWEAAKDEFPGLKRRKE